MQDFDRLIIRFRQFGGLRLICQYARMGVLWTAIKECSICIFTGRSFKTVYPAITKNIDSILTKKYKDISPIANQQNICDTHEHNIWFCWLQGMENAPKLVKACYNSILQNLPQNKVVIITNDNYSNYITLPDYIEDKYRKGFIPHPLFSDILRLELLTQYGGTWIDASVLCTGCCHWEAIQSSKLFLFRYFKEGKVIGISNWFIHAKAGNPLLQTVLAMLLAYWKDYNCTVEYYIFHLFFNIASRRFPEEIKRMPRGNSFAFIQLGNRLSHKFDAAWWNKLTSEVSFHKLNYRIEEKSKSSRSNYYNYIIEHYGNTTQNIL